MHDHMSRTNAYEVCLIAARERDPACWSELTLNLTLVVRLTWHVAGEIKNGYRRIACRVSACLVAPSLIPSNIRVSHHHHQQFKLPSQCIALAYPPSLVLAFFTCIRLAGSIVIRARILFRQCRALLVSTVRCIFT